MEQSRALDYLKKIDFKVEGAEPGTFSPAHKKYNCLICAGEDEILVPFQCNPAYTQPTIATVVGSLANDATYPESMTLDEFHSELCDGESITKTLAMWKECERYRDFLRDSVGIAGFPKDQIAHFAEALEDFGDELDAAYAEHVAEKAAQHPDLPDNMHYITDLQADLDTGMFGDELAGYGDYICDAIAEVADSNIDIYNGALFKWFPGNGEWIKEAESNGLLEGCKGDIAKMIQMGQYECYTSDLYKHQEDSVRYALYDHLRGEGVVAVSDDVVDAIEEIDCSDNNARISDLADELDKRIEELGDGCLFKRDSPEFLRLQEAARGAVSHAHEEAATQKPPRVGEVQREASAASKELEGARSKEAPARTVAEEH